MPIKIRSRFNHLVAAEEWTAQIRSWAASAYVPLLLPQILRDVAGVVPWHRLERWSKLQHKYKVVELHRMPGCSVFIGYMLVKWCSNSSWSSFQAVLLILVSLCSGNITQSGQTRIWTTDFKLNCLLKIALTLNSFTVLKKIIILK